MTDASKELQAHTAKLQSLLKKEQDLLLAGEAREAAELQADKLALLDLIDPLVSDESFVMQMPDNLKVIERLARENASLLSASLNGLRGALLRLSRIGHDTSVGAYDQSGAPLPFDSPLGTYQRKF